jgi:hypothetical protein
MDLKAYFKAISLGILAVSLLASGCKVSEDALTIWKAEVRSPDGLWIASVRTIQNGGFGSAGINTIVYLKKSGDLRPPVAVLDFDCPGPPPRPYVLTNANAGGTIDLKMSWVTQSHLLVTYRSHVAYGRHPDLSFQVVKFNDISISVRDLSNEPTNSTDSR